MKLLILALERTINHLEKSEDADWSNLTAGEIKELLKVELQKIRSKQELNKSELAVLFAPTGAIQETAIQNNWNKEYLLISFVIDRYVG